MRSSCRILLVAALSSTMSLACGDDGSSILSGTPDTESTGGPMTSGPDATSGMTTGTATTAMSASQGDSTGGADSTGTTGGETMPPDTDSATDSGGTDSGGTDSGGSDSGSDSGGLIPCLDASECDDTIYCNGDEICDNGFCAPGTPPDCADAIDCTNDLCDEASASCINVANNAACDNGMFCDGAETCNPVAGCEPGIAPDCDDGFDCTMDSCDDVAAMCQHVPDDSACQDMSVCNGPEVCTVGVGCEPSAGPLDCNDFLNCTIDDCDEGVPGGCTHVADDAVCDNGLLCDGEETCDLVMGCVDGPSVVCADDGIACTLEACSEAVGGCDTMLDDATCVAAGQQFCTTGGCVSGNPCADDSDCDDGNACDGIETCQCDSPPCSVPANPGVCVPNAPTLNCFDGIPCTSDACIEDDPASPGMNMAHCENTPVNAACADGNPCNGDEICDPGMDCLPGTPPNCDDGIACTTDACLPQFGCFSSSGQCDDGTVCNGAEVCTVGVGCQAGTPPNCGDDGFACTIESCDEAAGGCIVIEDDSICPCGLHCDPSSPTADADGCTNECAQAACDGTVWECGDCVDNDGDCFVDDEDPDCFGVCDNNESGFSGEIPGQNAAPCKMDCYFDDDSGSGNDDCNWSHSCDPENPQPDNCSCDAPLPPNNLCDANIPGYNGSCDDAFNVQSQQCLDVCGPVVPNGCDCFGCCEVELDDGSTRFIYLGTEEDLPSCAAVPPGTPCDNVNGAVGSCEAAYVDDPVLCHECTQVPACLNPCGNCELCFGQTELPPECGGIPECFGEDPQPCGVPGLPDCDPGEFCLTGCCVSF